MGGYSSKWYIDGVGYYNAVKESFLESDFSASAGLGVSGDIGLAAYYITNKT